MKSWIRRLSIVLLLLGGTSAFVWRTTRGANDLRTEEEFRRKAYADGVRQTYSYPFEKTKLSLPDHTPAPVSTRGQP